MDVFVFGDFKKSDNYKVIGEGGDYPSLENYLSQNFKDYQFTNNQLNITYFKDSAIFISRIHSSPLELRLQETTIPREATVVTSKNKIEDILENLEDYEDDDYDIFSGDKVLTEFKEIKIEILKNILIISKVFYKFLDAGYFTLENKERVDDWMVSFQEPIFDIFVRYFQIPSSALDISFSDEFINNPYLRKNICLILMKVLSNFLINNKYVKLEKVSKFKSWENLELWYFLKKEIKIFNS